MKRRGLIILICNSKWTEWYLHGNSDGVIFGLIAQYTSYFWLLMLGSTAVVLVKNDVLLLASNGNFKNWFSQMYLIKAWLSVKTGNDQKPRYTSCMVIELNSFKIFPFLPHGYHIPQFKKIAIPAWFSHPTISKFCQLFTMKFFRIGYLILPIYFFEICGNYVNYNYYCL